MSPDSAKSKMGFNATWSMAVGGMVGGGIFSVLGVVISMAGAWAWASLTLAGLIALATGHSYIELASKFGEGGGAFTFLRKEKLKRFAGSLSWVLFIGYVLTISVYAFTFAHYVGDVANMPDWLTRPLAGSIVAVLLAVNLLGVGEASWLEIVTVWGKLLVLAGLAAMGLWLFKPENIHYEGASPGGWAECSWPPRQSSWPTKVSNSSPMTMRTSEIPTRRSGEPSSARSYPSS